MLYEGQQSTADRQLEATREVGLSVNGSIRASSSMARPNTLSGTNGKDANLERARQQLSLRVTP
jgi:hypothetical protein